MLLIGSPVKLGIAAPPTSHPASWIVSFVECRLSDFEVTAATMLIKKVFRCWKYKMYLVQVSEKGADTIVPCKERLLAVNTSKVSALNLVTHLAPHIWSAAGS